MPFSLPRSKEAVCSTRLQRPMVAWVPLHLDASSELLANIVEGVTDWDIPNFESLSEFPIHVLPSTATYLLIQYRTPIQSFRSFGGREFDSANYRHAATGLQRGIAELRPTGPIGMIGVRLRADTAAHLLGERLRDLTDVKINLEEVFRARDVSLLAERLAEAPSSQQRWVYAQQFLLANLCNRDPDQLVCRAAALLRRSPFLRVQSLAKHLSISERHLSRRFQCMFGISLKRFARAARVEKIVAGRRRGLSWAELAYTCGFADQAHMINDVSAITGETPNRAFGFRGLLAW